MNHIMDTHTWKNVAVWQSWSNITFSHCMGSQICLFRWLSLRQNTVYGTACCVFSHIVDILYITTWWQYCIWNIKTSALVLLFKERCPFSTFMHKEMCVESLCALVPNLLPPPVMLLFDTKTSMKATASRLIKLCAGIDMNYAAALMNLNQ